MNLFTIAYTWLGDLNLDGVVDSTDLAMLNSGNGSVLEQRRSQL